MHIVRETNIGYTHLLCQLPLLQPPPFPNTYYKHAVITSYSIHYTKLYDAKYFPKYNEIGKARWVEATTVATKAYKKIEKYLPRMYSDCMKHIMLISDFEIRDRLEDELKQRVTSIIQNGIQAVITAYGAIQHYSISDCGCDVEGIKLLEEQMRREWVALQKVQEAKNKAAEKNFKEGILDENSDFYKKFIKEYSYNFV